MASQKNRKSQISNFIEKIIEEQEIIKKEQISQKEKIKKISRNLKNDPKLTKPQIDELLELYDKIKKPQIDKLLELYDKINLNVASNDDLKLRITALLDKIENDLKTQISALQDIIEKNSPQENKKNLDAIKKVLLDIGIAPSGYNDGKALEPVKYITQKDDGTVQISARAHLRVVAEKYIQ